MHIDRDALVRTAIAFAAFVSIGSTSTGVGATPIVIGPRDSNAPAQHVPNANVRSAVRTGAFNIVHTFAGPEGANPLGALDVYLTFNGSSFATTLYGEASGGGSLGNGTLFKNGIQSGAYTDIHNFTSADGASPQGGLASTIPDYVLSGLQYGVTQNGGATTLGTVFSVDLNGAIKTIHSFTGNADGATPVGRLVRFIDGNYYGTTSAGGLLPGNVPGAGTIFKITPAGQFSVIHTFSGGTDGGTPLGGLSLRVNLGGGSNAQLAAAQHQPIDATRYDSRYISRSLYGVAAAGGSQNSGTVYAISPSGAFSTIYNFTNGLDGSTPVGELQTDLAGDLFGVASQGGQGVGTVFKVAPSNAFATLYVFPLDLNTGLSANGAQPAAGVTYATNGALYGTTQQGGAQNLGTVWKIANGSFSVIHSFTGPDGSSPQGRLADGLDGYLYGTAPVGGTNDNGVIYRIGE